MTPIPTASIKISVLTAALLASAATAHAQIQSIQTTRVPTGIIDPNLETRSSTAIRGINDSGQYVGTFGERNLVIWGMPHGFIHGSTDPQLSLDSFAGVGSASRSVEGYRLSQVVGTRYLDPQYRYLDLAPAAAPSDFNRLATIPNAINNAGVVVGTLTTDEYGNFAWRAFRYDTRTRSLDILNLPGAVMMEAMDINASGQIVGNFMDSSSQWHGFFYSGGVYSVIDRPGYASGGTRLRGLNDAGTIVGSSDDVANINSFTLRNGVFTDFTANALYTVASDINDADQVVGWVGVSGQRRGFLWQSGLTTILDLSAGNQSTYAYSINNLGQIAGEVDGIGFIAQAATPTGAPVSTPSTLALVVACGLACVARRRPVMTAP